MPTLQSRLAIIGLTWLAIFSRSGLSSVSLYSLGKVQLTWLRPTLAVRGGTRSALLET